MSFSSDTGMGEWLDRTASRFSPVYSVLDVKPPMQAPFRRVSVGQDEKRRKELRSLGKELCFAMT